MASETFESAMTELPRALMRWEWFSQMKDESIHNLLKQWKEFTQLNKGLKQVRGWHDDRNFPGEDQMELEDHLMAFRFYRQNKWTPAYISYDEDDWKNLRREPLKTTDLIACRRPGEKVEMWWIGRHDRYHRINPIRMMCQNFTKDMQECLQCFPVVVIVT
jgi:hypothetical protein